VVYNSPRRVSRVVSYVCASICVCVLCMRALKGKRLEPSTPKSAVELCSMVGVTWRGVGLHVDMNGVVVVTVLQLDHVWPGDARTICYAFYCIRLLSDKKNGANTIFADFPLHTSKSHVAPQHGDCIATVGIMAYTAVHRVGTGSIYLLATLD